MKKLTSGSDIFGGVIYFLDVEKVEGEACKLNLSLKYKERKEKWDGAPGLVVKFSSPPPEFDLSKKVKGTAKGDLSKKAL